MLKAVKSEPDFTKSEPQLNLMMLLSQSLDRLDIVQEVMKDGSLLDALFDYDDIETGLSRHLSVICCKLKNLIDDEKI